MRKGNAVPALDKVMVQALIRWRAKPGPMRVVDIYRNLEHVHGSTTGNPMCHSNRL